MSTYYENCPGCKVEKKKEMQRGMPIRDLVTIGVVVLCNSLPISSLFPFLYFMVRDFQIAERDQDIGFYAGFIGSSFMFGRVLTSFFWGRVADRYGRKPVIIFGTVTVVIFNTLFGLSVNYWMAIITRFLLGSLNGLLGPVKAYASEIFSEEYHALGMSTVSTAWGIGLIIGPALGGYLAQPADNYPNIFSKESLFSTFPYFLPCLCISVFALIVTIFCFWLPETLHKHDKKIPSCDTYNVLESETNGFEAKDDVEDPGASTSEESLFKNWPLMSSIIIYSLLSLHSIAYSEVFSLWAESPRKYGGLSYSTEDVGQVLSISGVGLLIYQFSLYQYIERIFGPIMIIRIATGLSIPVLACYPFLASFSGFTLQLLLNCASMAKNILGVSAVTGLFILQNQAVDQHQRGAANGISMTAMSIFKAIGPAGAGSVFSWAQKRMDASFLPGLQMVFFILNVISAIAVLLTFKPFLIRRNELS